MIENNSTLQDIFAFPASAAQRRLWILSQFGEASAAYNIPGVLHIKGPFQPELFRESVAYIMQRHESLRTAFEKEDEILQIVYPEAPLRLNVVPLPEDGLQALLQQEITRPFDLAEAPLFRITQVAAGPDECYIIFCMHHLISDGWSLQLFIQELSVVYPSLAAGSIPALQPLPVQYSDYTLWQQQLPEEGLQQQTAWWQAKLQDAPVVLELPVDHTRPHIQTFTGHVVTVPCGETLSTGIYALGRHCATTPYVVLLAAFNVLLSRYAGQEDIVVGSPVANRPRRELEQLIGFFVNTLPLRTQLQPEDTFTGLLGQVKQTVQESLLRQDVPLEKILAALPQSRTAGYHPLFQVMFSLDAFGGSALQWEGLETAVLPAAGFFSKFDVTLAMREEAGQFTASWEYNTALFREETIRQMAAHFNHILEQVTAHPSLALRDISLLSVAEKERILVDWNLTTLAVPPHCLHTLVEEQAALHPQRPAVTDATGTLSYEALNRQANQLAHYLLAAGLGQGQCIGICLERTASMLVALLAVMKAGGVYVPVDPAYPQERKNYLLTDAGICYVITQSSLAPLFEQPDALTLFCMDELDDACARQPATTPALHISADEPVYMIYTSGSTGQPKGVRIPHNALVNFLHSMVAAPGITAGDRLLAVTSLSFDIAGLELYAPLLVGAVVVIAGREIATSGSMLMESLEQHNITVMQATPATWVMLRDAGWEGKQDMKILCGGEAFPRELANWLLTRGREVWNMYGPTETTIWSAIYRVLHSDMPLVPLGRPIANTSLYILDSMLQPVPVGVTGDLYIGGKGLATGYHQRPELTAERFVPHPFIAGERLYRTGDRARYLPDGNILFAGRADFQVKVNGYRIEPGEIEYQLSTVPGVKQAVVVARKGRLLAYVIPADASLTPAAMREALQQQLPAHMLPSVFVLLDAFPLTPNGKIDRQALPEPDMSGMRDRQYEAPATRKEEILAGIWQEVLQLERVGVNDNFFELGGASLQSINVVTKAGAYGMMLTPEKLFEFQTIRELARHTTLLSGVHTATGYKAQEELQLTEELFYRETGDATGLALQQPRIIIESMACYLPEKEVSTNEILAGCRYPIRFPMQRLTGIHSRRETADGEYAFGMAVKAMEHCFAMSRYRPGDIDLLISCNVFRIDRAAQLTIEPGTAIRLAWHFQCTHALTMDISNACAGIFTAMWIAETMIRNGSAERVMLVSGEYLTHLTDTAQQEIRDYMDLSISALTVGDSGLAMILEAAPASDKGLLDINLFTMGGYSDLCVVKTTREEKGGLLLKTDAIRMAEAGHLEASRHALRTLKKNRWTPETVDFLIMHQASSTTTANTMRQVNRLLNNEFANRENTIDNIRHRGNTATTTHWLAIQDNILADKINAGDRAILFISGSGLNIGTALYCFDDLPDRMRRYWQQGRTMEKVTATLSPARPHTRSGVQLGSLAVVTAEQQPASAIGMATAAAAQCLAQSPAVAPGEIGLLIYAGMHRDDHLYEPAIATIVAGELSINATAGQLGEEERTICFDVFNSDMAWLQACLLATETLQAQHTRYALITTAEMEPNAGPENRPPLGIYEGAAACVLHAGTDTTRGFGAFMFRNAPHLAEDVQTWVQLEGRNSKVYRHRHAAAQQRLIVPLQELVQALLQQEGLTPAALDYVIPPFTTPEQIPALREALGLADHTSIVTGTVNKEMASLTLPVLLSQCLQPAAPPPGTLILLISAGAGGQLGCALYHC